MFNRRKQKRERLEVYLLYLILAYRILILIGGLFLLIYAITTIFMTALTGFILLLPAVFLLLLSNSYTVALHTAKLGAWVSTLGRNDD